MNAGQEERGTKRRGTAAPAWKKPPMRNETTPLRHSQFSDAVGSGVRIIFNIDAYAVGRFALHTYSAVVCCTFAVGCGALVLALS